MRVPRSRRRLGVKELGFSSKSHNFYLQEVQMAIPFDVELFGGLGPRFAGTGAPFERFYHLYRCRVVDATYLVVGRKSGECGTFVVTWNKIYFEETMSPWDVLYHVEEGILPQVFFDLDPTEERTANQMIKYLESRGIVWDEDDC